MTLHPRNASTIFPRSAPESIVAACDALWRLTSPGPRDLFKAPEFLQLRQACRSHHANVGSDQYLNFALLHALRASGLPCLSASAVAARPDMAAEAITAAFGMTAITWTHLCPLNLASDLPAVRFGAAEIGRFDADELGDAFAWSRLACHHPVGLPDLQRLARFQWLVVRNTVPAEPDAGARALPTLSRLLATPEPAVIEPHANPLPAAVEQALFFLLLAPWEDWAEMPAVDWRGFTLPWVYSHCDDLFVRPAIPPSTRSLAWEPRFATDADGKSVEWEAPVELPLKPTASQLPGWLSAATSSSMLKALGSPLFTMPVAHFLVRAYPADGIDEFLAHLTTLEAALGTEHDHRKRSGPHRNLGATRRIAARVSGLLSSDADGKTYNRLFDLRSAFIHGRPLQSISVDDRVAARGLARRVVWALTEAAVTTPPPHSRDDFLEALLDRGHVPPSAATVS